MADNAQKNQLTSTMKSLAALSNVNGNQRLLNFIEDLQDDENDLHVASNLRFTFR
jgi:hypothetical protein